MARKSKPTANDAILEQTSGPADLSHLERMLAFMELHGLEEFEYEHAGLRVRLRKPSANTQHAPAPPARYMAVPAAAHAESLAASPAQSTAAAAGLPSGAASSTQPAESEELHLVKSPIVGTFYECPTPGAPSFVKVGDQVTAGQMTYDLRRLKTHGLIVRIEHTHRYRVTDATWNDELILCPLGTAQVHPGEACNKDWKIQQNDVPPDIAATNPLLGRHGAWDKLRGFFCTFTRAVVHLITLSLGLWHFLLPIGVYRWIFDVSLFRSLLLFRFGL